MKKRSLILLFLILVTGIQSVFACAVCSAAVQSNAQSGGTAAAGMNNGVMYLLVIPYILIFGIGYLMYKYNKKTTTSQ